MRDGDRQPPRGLVQPAVPEGRLPSAPARHPVRQARAHLARPADAEPAVRGSRATRSRGGTDDARPIGRPTRSPPCTPAASSRSTKRPGSSRRRCSAALVHQALQPLPAELPDPLPAGGAAAAAADRSPRARSSRCTFPPADASIAELNAFRIARAPAPDLRGVLPLPARHRAAPPARRLGAQRPRGRRRPIEIREAVRRVLPFKLTGDQKTVIREIVTDMQRPQPMNRLLQGDVGSGKTIVALMAALVAMENGLQVAFMAPTEILAEQHYFNIRRLLEQSRFRADAADRRRRRRRSGARCSRNWPAGRCTWSIGTHALVQEDVAFRELGPGDHRRAAPLRRAAARDAARQGPASRTCW